MAATILVVDDEKNIRRTLRMVLEGVEYNVLDAGSAEEALELFDKEEIDLAMVDIRLPKMSGVELLQALLKRTSTPVPPVIMISGHASLAEAVQSIQLGAADFLEKPLDRERVLVSIQNALRSQKLEREVKRLRAEVGDRYQMIGESPVMRRLFDAIEKVAPTKGRVLITGESGTGKELIARAIHRLSERREAPFIMLNCAAIPAELIESELFGHERGAFTGAAGRKRGMFELADGGTLFLDEIGDMSVAAQAKVLRALQSGEISRVGSERSIAVDVRVLAATNKDLESEVTKGQFRDDLYFRLNVVPIKSPALRERVEDVPALARAFFDDFCREYGGRAKPVEPVVFKLLADRAWPGNVRELRNVVERMVILSGSTITADDVPQDGFAQTHLANAAALASAAAATGGGATAPWTDDGKTTLREFRDRAEKDFILKVLETLDWNISRAATRLGVERTNLHKKMRQYGIRRDDERGSTPVPG